MAKPKISLDEFSPISRSNCEVKNQIRLIMGNLEKSDIFTPIKTYI